MKANKLVSGSGMGFRCADLGHCFEVYCSGNWSATKATLISGGRNLYEPGDINIRRFEYLGISRIIFDLNQWVFSQ